MNPDEKTLFDSIISLIDEKEFAKAESELNLIISSKKNSEEAISYACFLIGYIHTRWDNKDKKQHLAKRMLLACIESNFPIPQAYSLYADQEKDKNIAINYLKAGLSKFPESSSIYLGILKYCKKDETIKYINEIENKNIVSIGLLNKVIEILISMTNWEKAEIFLQKLLKHADIPDYDRLYYEMLYTFSLVIQEKDIEKAKERFLWIIENDLSNNLKYSPYMGYIWCCVKMNLTEEVVKYFDKIPFSNGLEDLFDGPWCIINIDFNNIYKRIFGEIATIIKNDKRRMRRLAALEAYYLYIPSESYGIYRYGKKHLKALKLYLKTDVGNLDVACAIFNMQKHYRLFFDAYKTYIAMLCEYLNPEEKYIDGIDFFDECSSTEIEQIYQDILSTLKSDCEMDFDRFVSGVFDYIVDYLYNSSDKEKHEKICAIANTLNNYYLKRSEKLFEIAYSYAELDNTSQKAERFYLLLLETQPENCAALNNLGVIYESRYELQKAKEYFAKAYELDGNNEKYSKNLQRVSLAIKESEKALNNVQKENAWFLGRLSKVYEAAGVTGELICTYKDRPLILSVSPQKADEIFDYMCKCGYLTKVTRGNSRAPNKYIINPLVKEYLWRENERIKENEFYESLGEKLNVDEIKKIGYTKGLQDLISSIGNVDLRDILLRDIRECAISLLTNQYKSCIVICGSIIEALLVYRIEDKGILKYDIGSLLHKKPKAKAVKEMNLNELLELAKAEKIIDIEEYHLSNYVRSYRNTIHPSCEVRKNYDVSEDTAKLMWSALLVIIKELLK